LLRTSRNSHSLRENSRAAPCLSTPPSLAAADEIIDWQPPILTFKAIVGASVACNPGPHVTDRGITDGSTGEIFPRR
jgi:hypothetical protein